MKILMVSTSDICGGAARAAFRLHCALLQSGIDSQMLVADKKSGADSVITLPDEHLSEKIHNRLGKTIRLLGDRLSLMKYKRTMARDLGPFSPQVVSNKKLVKAINEIAPDIIHLHWICGCFLSVEDIAKINAPVVWSLHDAWAFTGGCHCVAGTDTMCDKYTENCGNCDFLGSGNARDLSFKVWRRKKKAFAKIKSLTVIGLSRWLQNCAARSSVFAGTQIINLPNPIDTSVYRPIDRRLSRKLLALPASKKLILFGAVSATSTPYKGFAELVEALNKINLENAEFVVFGSDRPKSPPNLPCVTHYLGHLHDDIILALLYSACDVTVVPSRRENLSNVIMESLTCGTPVVCFDIGGNSDMVEHKINGYLARPFDTSDLANGIDWVLNDEGRDKLLESARKKIVHEFDCSAVTGRYISLYESLCRISD